MAEYYHGMEHGSLPADGVGDRVLEVLAGILGTSADRLREAGSALAPGNPEEGSVAAFARTAMPDERYEMLQDLSVRALTSAADDDTSPVEEWDEVDELFRGPRQS